MSEIVEIIKKCGGPCGKEKIANEENFRIRNGKFISECRECVKAYNIIYHKAYNEKIKENPPERVFPEEKQCTKCGKLKKLNKDNYNFNSSKNNIDSRCRICSAEDCAIRYEENLKKQGKTKTVKIKLDPSTTHKNCTQCDLLKNIKEEFYRPGYSLCKICTCENNKIKHDLDPEWKAKKAKTDRAYLENNREKVKLQRKNARKKPKNKIRHLISSAILKALKRRNTSKNKSISSLSYSVDELIAHLESLFEPWMTLDNNGVYDPKTWDDNDSSTWVWQIDHIKPDSHFNYESMDDQEFQECWSLSNLRPYSAKLNIIEQDNR